METTFKWNGEIKITQSVRRSSYGDYIALDFINKKGDIINTPFYISNGKQIEVHWPTPSNERVKNPITYDDWYDKYLFKMINGELYVKWLNSPFPNKSEFDLINPDELPDWKFQYAYKIGYIKKIEQ